MFVPNSTCYVERSQGTDEYGMPIQGLKTPEKCTVVKLDMSSEKSSVRADSSASRGNAIELEAVSTILLTAKSKATIDDLIVLPECTLRIVGIMPRRNLQGVLDHYQVSAQLWSKE